MAFLSLACLFCPFVEKGKTASVRVGLSAKSFVLATFNVFKGVNALQKDSAAIPNAISAT